MVALGWAALALVVSSRFRPTHDAPADRRTPTAAASLHYAPTPVGAPPAEFGRPWVTDVQVVDLDQDGLLDILYCEGQKNSVRWIRQRSRGVFEDVVIGDDIPGPAHVWAADVNGSGRLDGSATSWRHLPQPTGFSRTTPGPCWRSRTCT